MERTNPFALIKASDISDEKINSLWVNIGDATINEIIEPRSRVSKLILGGKGTGKTHILRYFSYPALCLRYPGQDGLSVLTKNRFLAVFLRANGMDAFRFDSPSDIPEKWHTAFAFYFEIRLIEAALEVLSLVRASAPAEKFDDLQFLGELRNHITDPAALSCRTFDEFREWIVNERRKVDQEVNNAAFSGSLNLRIPFSLGDLSLNIGRCLGSWNISLKNLPFIYLLDEIENFSVLQQQVVNTLIRYGEGRATFRVGGRLYAMKTFATLANGEENREGAEFKTIFLDKILLNYRQYPEFAKKFIIKRLVDAGVTPVATQNIENFEPKKLFSEIDSRSYFSDFIGSFCRSGQNLPFIDSFRNALQSISRPVKLSDRDQDVILQKLTKDYPILIKKLNILLFVKNARGGSNPIAVAESIAADATAFIAPSSRKDNSYARAYGHYSGDLFAQVCRELKCSGGVPYAGFENCVKMSSGNPRNLLVVLGRIYSIAAFKEKGFIDGKPAPIDVQTTAASEAAKFMFEQDTNFGTASDIARYAVSKLATLLRVARYALNVPESSPLAVSYDESHLTDSARTTLKYALHFSFLFEIDNGRPDRNSGAINKKVQLNPMLSPRWGLSLGRRGDLKLKREMLNAIFEKDRDDEFAILLKALERRWDNPFSGKKDDEPEQVELFPHD